MPLVQPLKKPASAGGVAETEQFPALKPCPRSSFTEGHNDWLQITLRKPFPDFDICPDCYNIAFRPTRYAHCISLGPAKPKNVATKCDFSDIWSRIAYAWLFMQDAADLTIMGSLTRLQSDEDGTCPNFNLEDRDVRRGGKSTVTRRWYCLRDPRTNKSIEDLTSCSDCVAHVEWIFPCLKGIFELVAGGQKVQGTCDLMMLGNGQTRCLEYMDCIMEVAKKAVMTGVRDVAPLAEYLKKWAAVPVCKNGAMVAGETNYSLPSSIPEFTACQECYMKHIKPMLSAPSRPEWLSMLKCSTLPPDRGFMCDLFSPRLQQYFQEVCATNDVQTYRQKLNARNNKMQEIDIQLGRMKQEHQQLKLQAQSHMNMMQVERMRASTANTVWMTSGWIAPPVSTTMELMSIANM